jgi:DNA-binding beta-propeller fold protein YncE
VSRRLASKVLVVTGGGTGRAVAVSPDDRFAFVSLQNSHRVAVFNLGKALTAGFGQADLVGQIPEAFSAAKLRSDPVHALVARVAVGQRPLGLALVNEGAQLIVADSNRDNQPEAAASLAVVDVPKALAGKPALTGFVAAGRTPRQFALEPGGGTLLVVDTGSGQVQANQIGRLP